MKRIVSVSLGPASADYAFTTTFLGQQFHVRRFGADGDVSRAAALLEQYQHEADACGLGMVRDPAMVGTRSFVDRLTARLERLVTRVPVTTGAKLRTFFDEWAVRHVQSEDPGYFTNARVLFLSGIGNYRAAATLAEYTKNLRFADPVTLDGIPVVLRSLRALECYAAFSARRARRRKPGAFASELLPRCCLARCPRNGSLSARRIAAGSRCGLPPPIGRWRRRA